MNKEEKLKQARVHIFKNESKEDKHILTLSGVVAGNSIFYGENISAKDVKEALDEVEKDIVIKLNSVGGDVFEGIEIYNYLKSHTSNITVEVTALAASAASIIAMGADEVVMHTGASMMIHEASTLAYGNKADVQKTLNALQTIDESLIDIYAERTSLERKELENMMVAETWMGADEAVEKGFANSKIMVETPEETQVEDEKIAYLEERISAMSNRIEQFEAEKKEVTKQKDIKNNKNYL